MASQAEAFRPFLKGDSVHAQPIRRLLPAYAGCQHAAEVMASDFIECVFETKPLTDRAVQDEVRGYHNRCRRGGRHRGKRSEQFDITHLDDRLPRKDKRPVKRVF